MKDSTPVVISYLRFSRAEQLKGDSIRRQLGLGEAWAAKRGLKIAESFRDLGISAFRGKNAVEGKLSELLQLTDSGRIPRGSILLVEQLDRLSRSAVLDALELFLSLIRHGIKVVTLMDGMEYDRESLSRNMMGLQYSIMQMSLAHEESAKKSERLAHAWQAKRANINIKPLTRQLPAWLKVERDKIVIDEAKATVVRYMVGLALDGHGLTSVTKKMNAQFMGLARVKHFQRSYVMKILNNRALIGEFQPHRVMWKEGKRSRKPVGEVIRGYYPAIVEEKAFYAVQQQLASRRQTGGPQSGWINLFLGVLYDAKDGSRLNVQDKGCGRRYVSSAAILGRKNASPYVGFPVEVFERAVLLQLNDLILPHLTMNDGENHQVNAGALEARISEVDRKIAATQAVMLGNEAVNTASVVGMLTKLDTQRKGLAEELLTLRGEIAARSSLDLNLVKERVAGLTRYFKTRDAKIPDDDRVELRRIVRQVIVRIDCTLERAKRDYAAKINVKLRDGSEIGLTVFAYHVDTMNRDAQGHPIKPLEPKGSPMFRIGIGEPRWSVFGSEDGETLRVGRVGSPKYIDVASVVGGENPKLAPAPHESKTTVRPRVRGLL